MADSIRQRIIDAVVARMQLINGTGNYSTNVANVRDSEMNWDENELPAISVFDGDSNAAGKSSIDPKAIIHRMPVLVKGFLKKNESDAKKARTLIKDIMTAIRVDDRWTVSNVKLVMQSDEVHDGITRNKDSFEVEACEVEFEVQYITQKFNAEAFS